MTGRIATAFACLSMMGGCFTVATGRSAFPCAEDFRFLENLAADVVEASRIVPGASVSGGVNTTGDTLIRPGGRACYPAFWIRDFAMSLESGLITPSEQRHALLLTAENQQDTLGALPSGSTVPPGSVPDHITLDGRPIFFPGTLDDFEGQGGPRWGELPPLDDAFYFVHMAAVYVTQTGDAAILDVAVGGKSLMERLEAAFAMPPSRPDTGLVYAEAGCRGIGFGFNDTIVHTGDLLFASLLKLRAAGELAHLLEQQGDGGRASHYQDIARGLRRAVPAAFATDSGMLRGATETSAQPDVWGTAFAVYLSALAPEDEASACQALARAYRDGAIAWRGNIRHVPTTGDYSESTAWEMSLGPKNRYQNGAYWGTATGWVAYAIAREDPGLARTLAEEYVAELREGDFRKGEEFGSSLGVFPPGRRPSPESRLHDERHLPPCRLPPP